jgi:predicted house-cleaning noncanonical NTP pyrophosphatase (MazG superfamily)
MGRRYDKLVRDEILNIIEQNAERPICYRADEDEYERRLLDKLDEEVAEYRENREADELADILEVVHAIRRHEGVTADDLEQLRSEKAEERGRFEDRIVLERVES